MKNMLRRFPNRGRFTAFFAALLLSFLFLGKTVILAQTPSSSTLSSMSQKDLFKKADLDYKAGRLEEAREALILAFAKKNKPDKKYSPLLETINSQLGDREAAKGETACNNKDFPACEKQIAAAKAYATTPRVQSLENQWNQAIGEIKQKFDAALKKSEAGDPESALAQMESLKPFAAYLPNLEAGIDRVRLSHRKKLIAEGNAFVEQKKWDEASSRFLRALEYEKGDSAAKTGLDRIERGRKAYRFYDSAVEQQAAKNYAEALRALRAATEAYPEDKGFETLGKQVGQEWRQQLDSEIPGLLENADDFKSTRDAYYKLEEARALLPGSSDVSKHFPQASELFGANSLQRSSELEAIVDYSRIATALVLRLNAQRLMPSGTVKTEELKNLAAVFNRKRSSQILIAVDNLCAASNSFIQTLQARTKNTLESISLPDIKIRTVEEYQKSPNEDTQFQELRPDGKSATIQMTIGASKYLSERRSSEKPIEVNSKYVSGTEKVANPDYQRAQAEVEKIRKALDARKKRDKPTPEGWTDATLQQKLAELNGIERTNTQDKISDYTYQKIEHKQQTAVAIDVTLRDYFSREALATDTIGFHDEKEAVEIDGVRAQDVNGLRNQPVRLPSTEQVLREAERTVLEQLEKKISTMLPVYTNRFFNEAEKAFKSGQVDDAVEFYLCHWTFFRGKLDSAQMNRIADVVKRETGFDLFKQGASLLAMSIASGSQSPQ
jgi:thioredoxin-like negative regulator of GroEL